MPMLVTRAMEASPRELFAAESTDDCELLGTESWTVNNRPSLRMVLRRTAQLSAFAVVGALLIYGGASAASKVQLNTAETDAAGSGGVGKAAALFESSQPATCRTQSRGVCHCNCMEAYRSAHDDGGCCHLCCASRQEDHILREGHVRLAPPTRDSIHLPFDCDAGVQNLNQGWSVEKKTWCCHTFGKGCLSDERLNSQHNYPPLADASAIHNSHRQHLPVAPFTNRGDITDQRSTGNQPRDGYPYDCEAGPLNIPMHWPDGKKRFCCDTFHKGCFEHGLLHEDSGAFRHSRSEPANMEQNRLQQIPSRSSDMYRRRQVAETFDCAAGYDRREFGWSAPKKQWCCIHRFTGCFDADFPWSRWQIILGALVACILCIGTIICCRECSRASQTGSRAPQSAQQGSNFPFKLPVVQFNH